jgi:hypothetical protein
MSPLQGLSALTALSASAALLSTPVMAQGDSVEERLDRMEQENAVLRGQIDALATQLETVEFREIIPPVGDSAHGMGPAASKIYSAQSGLSIGGYGEAVYTAYAGDKTDTMDFVRNVLYVGYKFDDKWVFNSEIEVEHADEIWLEFAYLEYLAQESLNVRAGMLLMPMGFVNEMHEPTTYRGPSRPETERRIIPSTWRENGAGILGDAGDLSYKFYVTNGMDASGFSDAGLRGGRQKGSKAKASDLAAVARLDWACDNGLNLGLSGYYGDSGQGEDGLGNGTTTIFELHAQYQWQGLRLRGLHALATVDDSAQISAANGSVVGEEMTGWYLEAGYDVASALSPDCGQGVIPYIRYEQVDTHAKVAAPNLADPLQDERVTTMGIDWLPISNIVFKVAYLDYDQAVDSLQISLGYVF